MQFLLMCVRVCAHKGKMCVCGVTDCVTLVESVVLRIGSFGAVKTTGSHHLCGACRQERCWELAKPKCFCMGLAAGRPSLFWYSCSVCVLYLVCHAESCEQCWLTYRTSHSAAQCSDLWWSQCPCLGLLFCPHSERLEEHYGLCWSEEKRKKQLTVSLTTHSYFWVIGFTLGLSSLPANRAAEPLQCLTLLVHMQLLGRYYKRLCSYASSPSGFLS